MTGSAPAPVPPLVFAATAWRTNGDMIADVHRLGYLLDTDHVLDPTYGRGKWWTKWRPEKLTTHNRREDGSDFRALPYPDGSFDVVAYDPPYVCAGGRKTTGISEMHDRYGMTDAPKTPALLQQLINDGLTEAGRLSRRLVLVKCQNYVSGGKLWPGVWRTCEHAESVGLELVDQLEHLSQSRPQPAGRRQVHARHNYSTLLVFRVPRKQPETDPLFETVT